MLGRRSSGISREEEDEDAQEGTHRRGNCGGIAAGENGRKWRKSAAGWGIRQVIYYDSCKKSMPDSGSRSCASCGNCGKENTR
jgi:hypothetical protein